MFEMICSSDGDNYDGGGGWCCSDELDDGDY